MPFSNLEAQRGPEPPPIQERVRRLPGALLLTAGYYGIRAPWVSQLIRRPD
jgi:hypothetical protein